MTDRGFWSGYVAGIATALAVEVLALDVLQLPEVLRIGTLTLTVLVGVALVVTQRALGARRRGDVSRDSPSSVGTEIRETPLGDQPANCEMRNGDSRRPLTQNETGQGTATKTSRPSSRPLPPTPHATADSAPAESQRAGASPAPVGAHEPPAVRMAPTGSDPGTAVPGPEDLIQVWEHYWRRGDGHFKAGGLVSQLTANGFAARVLDGAAVGAGRHVLIVDPRAADRRFYVLPSFATSPRSVREWFDDRGDGALTTTTRRVLSVAVGQWTESGKAEVVQKGAVS